MRVLFATYSEKTHFHPMVPLAWALVNAGHEVRVASQPALTEVITRTGLTAVPVGADHNLWRISGRFLTPRFAQANPAAYKRIRGTELPPFDRADDPPDTVAWDYLLSGYEQVVPAWYKIINDPMVDDLVAFARAWRPDLVIWESTTHAAPIAAEAVGAAHGRLLWSLDIFGKTRQHFLRLRDQQPPDRRRDPLSEWITGHAERFGVGFSEDLVTGQFTIDQFPAALGLDAGLHRVPLRYVPYNGNSVVPGWVLKPPARPRVCITLGVFGSERFGDYPVSMRDLLGALADLNVEVVATVAEAEQHSLGTVPDNARVVSFVPLHALAPTCSAVIQHGGFGTVNTMALHGVPQISISEQHDTPILARKLAAFGAGLAEYYTDVTGEKIRDHVVRILTEPGFAAAADRLRGDMLAMPTPRDLVPRLEAFTERHGPTRSDER
jgi:glycosyltransferase (activator-dependent family)